MAILYRKRLIPDECIRLDDDTIVHRDSDYIVTTWHTLHPKSSFVRGISLYLLKEGFKISYFLKADKTRCYIYCDIIDVTYTADTDTFVFTDLLADVIIENDGSVRVVDLDELAQCCKDGIITNELLIESLYRLDALLRSIYSGEFEKYKHILDLYME